MKHICVFISNLSNPIVQRALLPSKTHYSWNKAYQLNRLSLTYNRLCVCVYIYVCANGPNFNNRSMNYWMLFAQLLWVYSAIISVLSVLCMWTGPTFAICWWSHPCHLFLDDSWRSLVRQKGSRAPNRSLPKSIEQQLNLQSQASNVFSRWYWYVLCFQWLKHAYLLLHYFRSNIT